MGFRFRYKKYRYSGYNWYGIGTVLVRYWYGIGTVLVQYWYSIGPNTEAIRQKK